MPHIILELECGGIWTDLTTENVIDLGGSTQPIRLALVKHGMQSGKSSITIRIDLPDGRTVLTQTSLELFVSAALALKARDELNTERN